MNLKQAFNILSGWALRPKLVRCRGFIGECKNSIWVTPGRIGRFSGYCISCLDDMGVTE